MALILDLNGTLLYRSTTAVRDSKVPSRLIRGKHVYARHGMVSALIKLSYEYTLYVCTSMNETNALASLSYVFPNYKSHIRAVLAGDRYNSAAPNRTEGWETIRNVEAIWAAVAPHDATNSLFVDNEARKCVNAPRNCLVVPEMGTVEVRTGTTMVAEQLERYLSRMASSLSDGTLRPNTTPLTPPTTSHPSHSLDVREYLSCFPPSIHTPTLEPEVFLATPGTGNVAVTDLKGQVEEIRHALRTTHVSVRGHGGRGGVRGGGRGTSRDTSSTERHYDTLESLRKVLADLGVGMEECTLSIDHVDGTLMYLSDVPHRIQCSIKLPLRDGDRVEKRIALSRLLGIRSEKTFTTRVNGSVATIVLGPDSV